MSLRLAPYDPAWLPALLPMGRASFERQREGVGELLLEWAKAFSDGRLGLFTFARNAGARAFYARQGFKVVAQGFEPAWQLEDVRLEWAAPTLGR